MMSDVGVIELWFRRSHREAEMNKSAGRRPSSWSNVKAPHMAVAASNFAPSRPGPTPTETATLASSLPPCGGGLGWGVDLRKNDGPGLTDANSAESHRNFVRYSCASGPGGRGSCRAERRPITVKTPPSHSSLLRNAQQ